MSYWDAVLVTLTCAGYALMGLAVMLLFILCIYLTFGEASDRGPIRHSWWVRTLGVLYLVASVIFGIAFLIWSVQP